MDRCKGWQSYDGWHLSGKRQDCHALAIVAAVDQLCAAGWLDGPECRDLQLAFEVEDGGSGWYYFHHHHFHVSHITSAYPSPMMSEEEVWAEAALELDDSGLSR